VGRATSGDVLGVSLINSNDPGTLPLPVTAPTTGNQYVQGSAMRISILSMYLSVPTSHKDNIEHPN
jgi:hypothetical protein